MNGREWVPPGVLILGLLSINCTVPFVSYTASIVNRTEQPVEVRLRVAESGGSLETTTVTLPAGGSMEHVVRGDPTRLSVEASLVKGGAAGPVLPSQPTVVVTESPTGLTLVAQPGEPKGGTK
jgi:hypothetical protein